MQTHTHTHTHTFDVAILRARPEVISDSPSISNLSCNQSIQIKTIKWTKHIESSERASHQWLMIQHHWHWSRCPLFVLRGFIYCSSALFATRSFALSLSFLLVYLCVYDHSHHSTGTNRYNLFVVVRKKESATNSYIYRIFILIYLHWDLTDWVCVCM